MLKILNNIGPFIEDNYIEYSVRDYAKLCKTSPPTASKILKELEKERLLIFKEYKKSLLFRANRENNTLKTLSIAYWQEKLKDMVSYLSKELNYPKIILFGSLTKLEVKEDSDIDLYIGINPKEINLNQFEKKLKRKIQLHFKSALANKNRKENREKGVIL